MRVCLERRKMMEGSSCGNDEEERRIPNEESAMNIEIRDAALEARIKRQLQATGSASVEEVLARLLETQEEQDCCCWRTGERSRQRSGSESSNSTEEQLDAYLADLKAKPE
jgi:hypothetical protein